LGVIADGADGGTAEPRRFGGDGERRKRDAGVERGIEEDIQMIVGEGLATPGMQLALAAVVGAEDEERRGAGNPGLGEASRRQQLVEGMPYLPVLDDDDVALLQVALAGRGKGKRAKDFDQLGRHLAVGEGAAGAARRQILPGLRPWLRPVGVAERSNGRAEPVLERRAYACFGVIHVACSLKRVLKRC
jgi:hypothetical protein